MHHAIAAFATLLIGWNLAPSPAQACERPLTLNATGNLKLEGMLTIPCGLENDDVTHAVVLVHGSGPSDMDGNVTAVTRDQKKNLLLKGISSALMKEGFAVIRYHKRSYQWQRLIQKDPKLATSAKLKDFQANAYKHLLADVESAVQWAQTNLKNAQVTLLGHSQGTFLALQAAHTNKTIKGVALLGFYATGLGTLAYSQIVHRTIEQLKTFDTNSNGRWTAAELKQGPPGLAALAGLVPSFDHDGDKALSVSEIQSFLVQPLLVPPLADLSKQEAPYPSVTSILRTATFKTAFFHGTWDNQTPVFQTYAMEKILKSIKGTSRTHFRYFPRLGHGLDPRENPLDVLYQLSDPAALKTLAKDLKAFL
jgi:pimeloyl-ACP methyl ester carboxylesterase